MPSSTTPFAERGAVTDEYMDAMRAIWTQDKPVFHGKYVHIDGLLTDPKPLQKPYPPIWVGGESGPSMRRAARIGDAWYPIGSNNAHLLDTLPRLTAGIARMREMTGGRRARSRARWAWCTGSSGTASRRRPRPTATESCSPGRWRTRSRTSPRCARSASPRSISTFEGRDAEKSAADMKKFHNEVLSRI